MKREPADRPADIRRPIAEPPRNAKGGPSRNPPPPVERHRNRRVVGCKSAIRTSRARLPACKISPRYQKSGHGANGRPILRRTVRLMGAVRVCGGGCHPGYRVSSYAVRKIGFRAPHPLPATPRLIALGVYFGVLGWVLAPSGVSARVVHRRMGAIRGRIDLPRFGEVDAYISRNDVMAEFCALRSSADCVGVTSKARAEFRSFASSARGRPAGACATWLGSGKSLRTWEVEGEWGDARRRPSNQRQDVSICISAIAKNPG